MNIIETLEPAAFTDYLRKYNNTICGRHPIGVLLHVSHYYFHVINPTITNNEQKNHFRASEHCNPVDIV